MIYALLTDGPKTVVLRGFIEYIFHIEDINAVKKKLTRQGYLKEHQQSVHFTLQGTSRLSKVVVFNE